jgi:hypothetical protein
MIIGYTRLLIRYDYAGNYRSGTFGRIFYRGFTDQVLRQEVMESGGAYMAPGFGVGNYYRPFPGLWFSSRVYSFADLRAFLRLFQPAGSCSGAGPFTESPFSGTEFGFPGLYALAAYPGPGDCRVFRAGLGFVPA